MSGMTRNPLSCRIPIQKTANLCNCAVAVPGSHGLFVIGNVAGVETLGTVAVTL